MVEELKEEGNNSGLNTPEELERMRKIKEQVQRTSIYISTNLREEDKTRFMKFCREYHNGDYAVGLRWLLDLSEGFFVSKESVLNDKIEFLADRLGKVEELLGVLQEQPQKEEGSKGIRMLNGRRIKTLEE